MIRASLTEALKRVVQAHDQAQLDLSGLGLSALDLEVVLPEVQKLSALTMLSLDDNQLQALPERIGDLNALTQLSLDGNPLRALPERIGDLNALTQLFLNDNQLRALPERIGDLSALTMLSLDDNQLQALPERISDLNALTQLWLGGNQLRALPERIGDLSALTTLRLGGNQLRALPERIGDLSALTTLRLDDNQLQALPERIGDLSALTMLTLHGNQLQALPERIGDLNALTTLWLGGNQMQALPERIGDLSALTTLSLDDNQLRALPERIGDLNALTTLRLGGNQLRALPERIGDLNALTTLSLDGNQLQALPERIGDLNALTTLTLDDNQLQALPERIGDLNALTQLWLGGNQLRALPERIGDLSALTTLRLDDNQLAPEILAAADAGSAELISFLGLLRVDGADVAEAKLVFVGEGAAGKSTLLAALRGDPWVENRPQTHGMQIKPVLLSHQGREITLNGWDFGGQKAYRSAHQVFFTAPAVYVVVWDPRIGHGAGLVTQWLAMISHRAGPLARVHVVATHGGPTSRADEIDQAALRERFGAMIVGFHDVDSAGTDARLDALKAAIAATADALPHVRRRYPRTWLRTIAALDESGEQSLAYSDYQAIAAKHQVPAGQARSLAANAHALGRWVYYDDEPALREVVVLKPDWLSVAIARVLEDPEAADDLGLITHRRFGKLWATPAVGNGLTYTHTQQQVFLRLMERFELTYRVPELAAGEPTSLVAQLVPAGRPDLTEVWDDFRPHGPQAVEICQAIEKGTDRDRTVTPEGLIYRLIVRLHHQRLPRPAAPAGTHWQHGLVVKSRYDARALITLTPEGVRVAVRGPDPDTYLHQIADEIRDCIDGFWSGLTTRALVPCRIPCGLGTPGRGLFDVDKLLKAQDRGRDDTDCREYDCDARPAIGALLGGRGSAVSGPDRIAVLTGKVDDLARLQQANARQILQGLGPLATRDDIDTVLGRLDAQLTTLLHSLDSEAIAGPRLFTLEPLDVTVRRPGWTKTRMRLTLFCEHSRLPVHVIDQKHSGVYELEVSRDWWVKAAPLIQLTAGLLKPLIGVGLADLELHLDDTAREALKEQIALAKESAGAAADAAKALSGDDGSQGLARQTGSTGGPLEAEGAVLRTLHQILQTQDPTYADLRKVRDPQQRLLWVHRRYVPHYQPPLPTIP